MIASIRGEVIHAEPPMLVVEAGGVGYGILMPMLDFAKYAQLGKEVQLYTSLVVRDDSQQLYGFADMAQRDLFTTLRGISGIGPKSALALLSTLDPTAFTHAIESNDIAALTQAPGVGRKNAERIILELRGSSKLGDVATTYSPVLNQAIHAMEALGYPTTKARKILLRVNKDGMDVATLVKAGLAELSKAR